MAKYMSVPLGNTLPLGSPGTCHPVARDRNIETDCWQWRPGLECLHGVYVVQVSICSLESGAILLKVPDGL